MESTLDQHPNPTSLSAHLLLHHKSSPYRCNSTAQSQAVSLQLTTQLQDSPAGHVTTAAHVASCRASRSCATAASMGPSRDCQLLPPLLLCGHQSGEPRDCSTTRPIEAGSLLGTAGPEGRVAHGQYMTDMAAQLLMTEGGVPLCCSVLNVPL